MSRTEANASANEKVRKYGPDACLSLKEAASLLPFPMPRVVRWLRKSGLIRTYGENYVVWGDVLDRLRASPRADVPAEGAVLTLLDGGRP